MAKKLMMNNYSENGLMPVMDGLVCWFDAKDYKGDGLVKDRINNNSYTLHNEISKINNYFKFENGYILIKRSEIDIVHDLTIDVVVKITKKSEITSANAIFCMRNNASQGESGVSIKTRNNGFNLYVNNEIDGLTQKSFPYIIDKKTFFSLVLRGNNLKLYVDDELVYDKEQSYYGKDIQSGITTDYIWIGCNPKQKEQYKEFLGSLKIYNRALTEEEIQQNYAYEQSINRGE